MQRSFDVIVLGTGGVGSAALAHLARRGARVLGLDRFGPPHDRGSSHGQTRMIRQAYFEHPDYVPLVRRAFDQWAELEREAGRRLYFETGLLEVGPPGGVVVPGVLASARQHGLAVEPLAREEIERRWPGFRVPEGLTGVFEQRAGYLLVEECVRAQLASAARAGAELHADEAVTSWRADGEGVLVETDRGSYTAGRLAICCGAWAGELLADLGVRFAVRRKHQYWWSCDDSRYDEGRGAPAFYFELASGHYYGFPRLAGDDTVKIAEHSGGEPVGDPLRVDRDDDPRARERVGRFAAAHLPGVGQTLARHSVCMYTMSPDEHFVVDRHPRWPQAAFVAGLSGHGFKFAPVLGEILADLALEGRTPLPAEFLSLDRPGLRGGPPA